MVWMKTCVDDQEIGQEESESSLEARSEDEEGDREEVDEDSPIVPVTTDIPVVLTGQEHAVQDPSAFPQQRYIVETITMTTVTERRIVREADDHLHRRSAGGGYKGSGPDGDVKRSGILKGGKLWKSTDSPNDGNKPFIEETSTSFSSPTASSPVKDEEVDGAPGAGRRSVRFSEETSLPPDSPGPEDRVPEIQDEKIEEISVENDNSENVKDEAVITEEVSSPDSTELTLTFKLGNHVLVSNSLRPNSAVRQLFPAPRFLSPPPLLNRSITDESISDEGNYDNNSGAVHEQGESDQNHDNQQFIVTAESLKLFEEAKRSKLAEMCNNKELSFQDGMHECNQAYIAVMPPMPLITSPSGGNNVNSDDDDSTSTQIRRTIERNALRRSLLRYEPGRNKRNTTVPTKTRSEDSLVERIRKLTCDLDEDEEDGSRKDGQSTEKRGVDASTDTDNEMDFENCGSVIPPRSSPPGEESKKHPQSNKYVASPNSEFSSNRFIEKTSSPSSGSSSSSVSSGSTSSTYKKLTDLFARKNTENKAPDVGSPSQEGSKTQPPTTIEWRTAPYYSTECNQYISPPDLGNGLPIHVTPPKDFANGDNKGNFVGPKCAVSRTSVTAEARKQFLSTLAPLAACVSAGSTGDEENPGDGCEYYQIAVTSPGSLPSGDRASIASTSTLAGGEESEYSLDDIEEVLKEEQKGPQPDVVAGTQMQSPGSTPPNAGEGLASTVDELALFVQRDAGRIERIKKRYSVNSNTPSVSDEDDHDDYGFNRRPSVRGIKPRFGSTTEILQQMQTQLQPPMLACASRAGSHMTWPYCSPDGTPVTAEPPNIRRRGILHARATAAMPVLQEETAYPYDYNRGITFGPDYGTGIIVHQESPTESMRKDGIGRRYVTPNQIMYASTGNLYQPSQQIMRIGGGCAENQVYGTLSNRNLHHAAHLQHPPSAGSPPPPGVPRNYPQNFSNTSSPVQQVIPLPPSDSAGLVPYHHQYQADPRFASIQSLDRATGTIYGRRVPPPGMVQMRVSPVSSGPSLPQQGHYAGPVASASVRLTAPFIDPNITAVIEPHYSPVPHPNASSRSSPVPPASIIRVGQGQQQTIRVPYPTGAPVQVHLLTRTGVGGSRSESPQRGLGSPSGQTSGTPPGGQYPSPPQQQPQQQQYVVARGTQTSANALYQIPANARYYPPQPPVGGTNNGPVYNKGGMPYSEPVKSQLSFAQQHPPRRSTSPIPYQNISSSSSSTCSSSPTRSKYGGGQERGVPEGAASSSPSFPQDSMYHLPLSSTAPSSLQPTSQTLAQSPISTPTSTTSVYYAMNV
ncbi:mucin-17 [Anabrus simplex]|uniref:mucin-17 n=1 Tax=Anabrus simplex TaxID=316456 RepID=UPI0035A3B8B2